MRKVEHQQCSGVGKIWEDQGWDDDGASQTGMMVTCSPCEGTGQVTVFGNQGEWNFPSGNKPRMSLSEIHRRYISKRKKRLLHYFFSITYN